MNLTNFNNHLKKIMAFVGAPSRSSNNVDEVYLFDQMQNNCKEKNESDNSDKKTMGEDINSHNYKRFQKIEAQLEEINKKLGIQVQGKQLQEIGMKQSTYNNGPITDANSVTELADGVTKDALEMTAIHYRLLTPLCNSFNECIVQFDPINRALNFYGKLSLIRDCQTKVMLEMRKLKDETIVVSSEMMTLLSKERGKKYLDDLNSSGLNGAIVELGNLCVLVVAKEDVILSEAVKILEDKLNFCPIMIPKPEIPLERLKMAKLKLEYTLLVYVSFDDNKREIQISGVKEDVMIAIKEVNELFEEYKVYKRSVDVLGRGAIFLESFLSDHLIPLSFGSVEEIKFQTTKNDNVTVHLKGNRFEMQQAHSLLQSEANTIQVIRWDLFDEFTRHEVCLIANSFKSGVMKAKLETYKYKTKSLFIPDMSNMSFFIVSQANKDNPWNNSTKQISKDSQTVPKISSSSAESKSKLVFEITAECQLVVKSYGDMVSILGPDLDMRKTRVGSTFCSACPSHLMELKKEQKIQHGSPVVTIQKPSGLNCLAVCHVILAPWNPKKSLQQLNVALETVFKVANSLGAKSVSFPPMGCGRAFQFPPLKVAQQVVDSIRNEKSATVLNKVIFLALDSELYKGLKIEAARHFKSAVVPPKLVTSGTRNMAHDSEIQCADMDDCEYTDIVNNFLDVKCDSELPCHARITVATLNGNTVNSVKEIITDDIRKQCLHTEPINPRLMEHCPRESWLSILREAIKLSVCLKPSNQPHANQGEFHLIGEKHSVAELTLFIKHEYLERFTRVKKNTLTSGSIPKRGTVEFMTYAAESYESFPSYWSLSKSQSAFWKIFQVKPSNENRNILVDVDEETKDAITKFVTQTSDLHLVGLGNDAMGIKYSHLKVTDVKRVENQELFEKYRFERKILLQKMASRGHACEDIGKIPGSKGRVATSELLSESMKKELYHEVNEHYLFHGTKSDAIQNIIHNGLDPRLSNEEAMFGKGIYATEKMTKSDQYAGN
ncbi:unnamed protein product [Lymnaea stagnalis]|uniref:Poly [ADP-ribose] polymerase n=1 Tax=Lymnaea stagnalis TaxID=6523 RepID=A0AAV2HNJ8_LYMST